MPKVSVVILNWNGSKMMRQFLPSVVRYTSNPDYEVVVADNASTDDSLEMLSSEFPTVRQIILDQNYGFADGYNRALAQVEAEYVVLLNSDVEVTEGWLQPLVEQLDANPDVAACQPKLLAHYDRTLFEYAGASGGYIDRFGYPFCRGRIFETIEHDEGQYDDIKDIFWATGACFMIRLATYREAGGLDARFFAHNEEIDLCWRLHLYGHRITCVPSSVVYHLGGGTLPKGNPRKTYLNFRNNLTMLYKNLPDENLASVMRWRLLLDYVAVLQALLKCNLGDAKAIIRARRDFHRWQSDYLPIRASIQKKAVRHNRLTAPYSILLAYFLRKKRRYQDL